MNAIEVQGLIEEVKDLREYYHMLSAMNANKPCSESYSEEAVDMVRVLMCTRFLKMIDFWLGGDEEDAEKERGCSDR